MTFSSRGPTWAGCVQAARRRHANLIGFSGWWLDMPLEAYRQANVLYNLISPANLDGLVLWADALGTYTGPEAVRLFSQRLGKLPHVSLGLEIPGIPSLSVDNAQGIQQLMIHLIGAHACRQFLLICGLPNNPDTVQIRQAYASALQQSGLPWEPQRVISVRDEPDPTPYGLSPLIQILDEGRLPFDAIIVAYSSYTPLVLELLNISGLRVPGDVALVSFGQSPDINIPLISLTATLNPYKDCARMAVDYLLDSMSGQRVPERILLSAPLVLGNTCGCTPSRLNLGGNSTSLPGQRQSSSEIPTSASVAQELVQLRLPGTGLDPNWPAILWETLLTDAISAFAQNFLKFLENILAQAAISPQTEVDEGSTPSPSTNDLTSWQQVISVLRRHLGRAGLQATQLARAEDLLHQGREMVAEKAQQAYVFHAMRLQDRSHLDRLNEMLAATFDLGELMDVLAHGLPEVGIPAAYLALYIDPAQPAGFARLILAFDEHGRHPLPGDGLLYPAQQLVPPEFLPRGRRYTFNIEALYFRDKQIGFIVFEVQQFENPYCQPLRAQISAALQGAQLFQQAETARQSAEQADQMKSVFLSTVSHELRTPLALVAGLSEMMLHRSQQGHNSLSLADREDIQRIHISAQHLDRLIRDVLDLASSQVGQLKLLCEPLDMVETLQSAALMGEALAHQKGLAWQAHIPADLPRVWGDRTRLRQVILNLVSNAVKFTEFGEVTLSVSVELTENESARKIRIEVSDTGPGIPLAEQAHIFDEFHRTEQAAERRISGLGLGLAITRQLVGLHGGQIVVRSSGVDGEGSTFGVILPTLQEYASADELGAVLPEDQQTVLLLSDSPQEAEPLREYLKRQGFQVALLDAESTPSWLNSLTTRPPGAVILHVRPDAPMSWRWFQQIKENPTLGELPVLMFALPESAAKGAVLALDALTKPVEMQALLRAVERQGSPKTILVVDDDPNILAMHMRALQMGLPGVKLVAAENGLQALEAIAHQRPDLILLDLMMPKMDGFAVLETLQETHATHAIPVIVLTAQILTEREINRLSQGVAAVFSKGVFSMEEVLVSVEMVLGQNKRLGRDRQRLVRKAMAYIHEHYDDEISRQALADYVGISERYLTRCFNQELGLSPSTYLTRYRVEQAKKLLANSEQSVSQVAYNTGFSSVSYFGHVFRKETGQTPNAYRGKQT